jgi:hypothetical protein
MSSIRLPHPPAPVLPPLPTAPPEPEIPPVPRLASGVEHDPEMHRPPEQHPSLQVLLAQQMSPAPPQRAHTPSELLLVHALPG